MKEQKAMNYFHGVEGLNCVQSVLKVYQEEYGLLDGFIADAQIHGGGRAEEGTCGALYAIKMLIHDNKPEVYNKIADQFESEAGSLLCEPIKEMEKKTCRECVGIAARYLEEYIKG